ncbi:MAG: hypothetical protein LBG68_04190 [Coriobacteriales bacterium]|nr:hypothetical protein [Coriobacteriales bacterium]
MLALDLLRDKYDREFEIVKKSYNFDTTNKPVAYCCSTNEKDLVFYLEFNVADETIISDTYVGRKLGRQAENIITECLAEQGIKSAAHGDIDSDFVGEHQENEYNPDLLIEDFIDKYHDLRISASIVITDEVESPRSSPQFADAMKKVFHLLGDSRSSMSVYVVNEADFIEYRDHFLSVPWFHSSGMVLKGQPIELLRVTVRDSEIEISDRVYQ